MLLETEEKNPFTPVIGKVPLHFAGRENIIEGINEIVEGDTNSPSIVSLYVGARGTGKTALLNYYAEEAGEHGWIAVQVSCSEGMLDEIALRATRALQHLTDKESTRCTKSVSLAKIGSISWENKEEVPLNWRARMDDIFDVLQETETGLLITVDEVVSSLPELETLITCTQHFITEGRRFALALAGLPYGVTPLLSGKTTSFLRRAARYNLGVISDYEIKESLLLILADGGKSIDEDALNEAVRAIGGFPYMLQLVGYRAWRISRGRNRLTLPDIKNAISIAKAELNERVYDATWNDLTEADKAFLNAMLEDETETRQSDLAERLGKTSGHISRYKKRLLKQGIIQEIAKGRLSICLPGFREYLKERLQEEL